MAVDGEDERIEEGGRIRVLVVDDEAGIRRGCERVLKSAGYEVFLGETGEQGLEIVREHSDIAVALVDLKMPGIGGIEFIRRVKELSPDIVCVVITAYATIEAAVEATRHGALSFLTKPFTPENLLQAVERAVEQVRLQRQRKLFEEERRRRLLELATEQSRLRTIINCMADGVLVCNAEGNLVLYNPGALRVLPGIDVQRTVMPLGEVLQPVELFEMIQEASQGRKRLSREIELTHLPERPWVLADVAPVVEEASQEFLGTVTVLRDITQLKQIEQVKAQFMNMVAHELKAPLAAIDGYLSVMQAGLVPDEEKRQEMIARARERLKALADLVNDLLEMARMEAGTVRREIAPQKIGDIINATVELMRPLAEERQVTIEVDVPAELTPVEADREELIRLFNNLVSNAIKYNKPGGNVRITAGQEGPYVRVSVADTGVGISKEGLQRLFSEFFREKRPETSRVTGTGLGLSIVKRIVDFYHGRIDVESEVGQGTTFTVWLPCKIETSRSEAQSQ
ncbi:MAG: response regulator [Armatimonadetes bacterium]|nr:response regulator [Armatimonadota bacterium]